MQVLLHASVPFQTVLEKCRPPTAQHDVEHVGNGIQRDRRIEVEPGGQLLDRSVVRDRLHDWAKRDKWITLEVTLGNQPLGETCSKD